MSLNGRVGIDEHGSKVFLPLENNPLILNPLAHKLGLTPTLAFHDLYSFTEPELIDLVPRPALALLFVWPCTPGAEKWHRESVVEEGRAREEAKKGKENEKEKVLWFRQDVRECCGLMGLIHCTLNIPPSLSSLLPSTPASASATGATSTSSPPPPLILLNPSTLSLLQSTALQHPTPSPEDITARANLIVNSTELEQAHAEAATQGSTRPLALGEPPGHAFIAFVKDRDGGVWEMDGARGGPRFLGVIKPEEDLLSEAALKLGPMPYIEREAARAADPDADASNGDFAVGNVSTSRAGVRGVNFSCTVLAPAASDAD